MQANRRWTAAFAALIGAVAVAGPYTASAAEPGWKAGHNHRIRLVADGRGAPWAGVELAMSKGWKTYWRVPGDAGGVPPTFDWSGSENLASATVLYPAPQRLVDKGGETIGYKDHVLFPVRVEPLDAGKPVRLALAMTFGVCREICIPAEAELAADLPPTAEAKAPGEPIADALARVPGVAAVPGAPRLSALRVDERAKMLLLDAVFPPGASDFDAFVEGPAGVYIPMTVKADGARPGEQRFTADLSGIDMADVRGKALVVTLTAAGMASEIRRVAE